MCKSLVNKFFFIWKHGKNHNYRLLIFIINIYSLFFGLNGIEVDGNFTSYTTGTVACAVSVINSIKRSKEKKNLGYFIIFMHIELNAAISILRRSRRGGLPKCDQAVFQLRLPTATSLHRIVVQSVKVAVTPPYHACDGLAVARSSWPFVAFSFLS